MSEPIFPEDHPWRDDPPEFAVTRSLANTLTLLGCRKDIVELVRTLLDRPPSFEDRVKISLYNTELINGVKDRLHNLSTIQVQVRKTDDP